MRADAYGTFEAMRVPLSVRTVAEVIGMDAAVRLMRASYSNRQVYIPARDMQGHRLAEVLAPDELRALRRHFGGELLAYPRASAIKRRLAAQRRKASILADLQAGLPTQEIARKHGCTTRWVIYVKQRSAPSPPLPGLGPC